MNKSTGILGVLLMIACPGYGQGDVATPLQHNAVIKQYLAGHSSAVSPARQGRSAATDTLPLPFFDDFTYQSPFPDRNRWTDAYVFVNNSFPIDPPSHGVATFDNLNWNGDPYTPLNVNSYGPSDTLSSQAIDLVNRPGGGTYKPADSVFLSFWYQPQGRDIDILKNILSLPQDILILQYLNRNGQWVNTWQKTGLNLPVRFHRAKLAITDTQFFHSGFRFRFISYSVQSGNANHWNLDYVTLADGEKKMDSTLFDFAVVDRSDLLKTYTSMPWHQLTPGELHDSVTVMVKSLYNANTIFDYYHLYRDTLFTEEKKFQNTQLNIKAGELQPNLLPAWNMAGKTPTGDRTILKCRWNIAQKNQADEHPNNDSLVYDQVFANYLAYDDGTAETGYGLEAVPKGGKVCQQFKLPKDDTLWGISVFFNQCSTAVHNKAFRLAIWKSITKGTNKDHLVKEIKVPGPVYLEGLNRFAYFELDTPIALSAGDFYIGWIQDKDFILNVGQDVNYGKRWNYGSSKLIFWNANSTWQSTTSDGAKGALMIRAFIGNKKQAAPAWLQLPEPTQARHQWPSIVVYPNPTASWLYLEGEETANLRVFGLDGKLLLSANAAHSIDCSQLPAATYLLEVCTPQYMLHKKFVVKR